VALKWRTFLRLWLITKKQYKTRKVTVGTVKKSIAAIACRWFLRKINQSLRASPLRPTPASIARLYVPSHQHNAYHFEAVTVYYRWHPLFGQSLRVHKRIQSSQGEQVFCELPDYTLGSLPSWMLSPECTQFTLGTPLIAVEALYDLRDVLGAWRTASDCDKASRKQFAEEVVHEARVEAIQPAAESVATQPPEGGSVRRPAKRSGAGAGGTVD
jgi:hypothetical protein